MIQTASLQNSLLLLGFGQNEIEIYLKLLLHKKPTIAYLARECNLKRNSVYYALEKLEKMGLVEVKKDYSKAIYLHSPTKINNLLQLKLAEINQTNRELEEHLPDILGKYNFYTNSSGVKVYQGQNQIREALIDAYKKAEKEILFLGSSDIFTQVVGVNLLEFLIDLRIKKQVSHRVLAFANIQKLVTPKFSLDLNRNIKFLPKSYESEGFMHIIDNLVINWNPKIFKAIIIEDESVAKFYKNLFEGIWNSIVIESV